MVARGQSAGGDSSSGFFIESAPLRAVPWVIAKLRNQKLYARADEHEALLVKSGRGELRYRPNDGKLYQAGERYRTVVDPAPLPEGT